jgi:hypothetical protein
MGMSSDKDIKACLPHFLELVHHRLDRIHCTAVSPIFSLMVYVFIGAFSLG